MTTQNPTSPSTKDGLKDSLIEFPDNRLLIDLCGAYDQHLAAIEKALDVVLVDVISPRVQPDDTKVLNWIKS